MPTIALLNYESSNETLGENNRKIYVTGIYYFVESVWVYVKDYKSRFPTNTAHEKSLERKKCRCFFIDL